MNRPTAAERHLIERGRQGFRVLASAEAPRWRNYRRIRFAVTDHNEYQVTTEADRDR